MSWQSTWQSGPGAAQAVIDELELGPRVAMRWSSGRSGCARDQDEAQRLRRMAAGQLSLLEVP